VEREESQEDILLSSLKSLESIYRTYRLVYLAECYGFYGLALTAIAPTKEGTAEDLKSNLEKAYSLLEYADEIMTGDGETLIPLLLPPDPTLL
jgi:hypothetical protein